MQCGGNSSSWKTTIPTYPMRAVGTSWKQLAKDFEELEGAAAAAAAAGDLRFLSTSSWGSRVEHRSRPKSQWPVSPS